MIRSEQMDNPLQNMSLAKHKLERVKIEYETSIKELKKSLEEKTQTVVDRLFNAVNQRKFVKKFTSWGSEEYEQLEELTEVTEIVIETMIRRRFQKEIEEWEAENHVIEEALKSLMKLLKKYSDSLEFKIKAVEDCMVGQTKSGEFHLTTAQKVFIGVTSPVWIPIAIVGGIIILPLIAKQAIANLLYKKTEKKLFSANKGQYIKMKSKEFLENTVNKEYISSIIRENFTEVKINLQEMEFNFLKLISADMNVILKVLMKKNLGLAEEAKYYAPIHAECCIVRGELSMFSIEEVIPRKIDIQDLIWEGEPIGRGSFADVYQGSLGISKEAQVEVAVKVCNESLTNENAHQILSEDRILR